MLYVTRLDRQNKVLEDVQRRVAEMEEDTGMIMDELAHNRTAITSAHAKVTDHLLYQPYLLLTASPLGAAAIVTDEGRDRGNSSCPEDYSRDAKEGKLHYQLIYIIRDCCV
jgi:hypothetical protein